MRAGYSGTPLAKKLSIEERQRVATINAPSEFRDLLVDLRDDVVFDAHLASKPTPRSGSSPRRENGQQQPPGGCWTPGGSDLGLPWGSRETGSPSPATVSSPPLSGAGAAISRKPLDKPGAKRRADFRAPQLAPPDDKPQRIWPVGVCAPLHDWGGSRDCHGPNSRGTWQPTAPMSAADMQ